MSPGESRALRRLLIGLDASEPARAALEALAELASHLDAELVGLFVEDAALVGLGAVSATRVVDASTAQVRRLASDEMERELRLAASRARRSMEEAAERTRVRWSFRVVRGRPGQELVAASGEADLACVSWTGWRTAPRPRLGSTARELARASASDAVLLHSGASLAAGPVAVMDGCRADVRAIAEAVARTGSGRVVSLRPRAGREAGELAREAGASCLVLSADDVAETPLDLWLPKAGCSVLLLK